MTARPIIVGYDHSPPSRAALAWASQQASVCDAPVLVVYAIPPLREWLLAALQISTDSLRATAHRNLQGPWTEPLRERAIAYETLVVAASPGPALLDAARSHNALCLVVGKDQYRGFGHRGNGPVGRYVQHHAQRPVISVPPTATSASRAAGMEATGQRRWNRIHKRLASTVAVPAAGQSGGHDADSTER